MEFVDSVLSCWATILGDFRRTGIERSRLSLGFAPRNILRSSRVGYCEFRVS